ncbi:hypothetical protein P8452_17194 [Trifolium repens]|jgi:hypothetical protein|nr:hypothetical protein P8452_17194 [Trifolium repens]
MLPKAAVTPTLPARRIKHDCNQPQARQNNPNLKNGPKPRTTTCHHDPGEEEQIDVDMDTVNHHFPRRTTTASLHKRQ